MNQYLAMLGDCGGQLYAIEPTRYLCMEENLAAFVERIKAEEREACAKHLDAMHEVQKGRATEHNYYAIAAREIRTHLYVSPAAIRAQPGEQP